VATVTGRDKRAERGLDFVGNSLGDGTCLGVQVKFHKATSKRSEKEWLSFLAGCFERRVDRAIFVTTGQLSREQRQQAAAAGVTSIEGRKEVDRVAKEFALELFEEWLGDDED
jgi:Restriction endonuclease